MVVENFIRFTPGLIRFSNYSTNSAISSATARRGYLDYYENDKSFQFFIQTIPSESYKMVRKLCAENIKKLGREEPPNGTHYCIKLTGLDIHEISLIKLKAGDLLNLHKILIDIVGVIPPGSSIRDSINQHSSTLIRKTLGPSYFHDTTNKDSSTLNRKTLELSSIRDSVNQNSLIPSSKRKSISRNFFPQLIANNLSASKSLDDVLMLEETKIEEKRLILRFYPIDVNWRKEWCAKLDIYEIFNEEKEDPYSEFIENIGKSFDGSQYPKHIGNVVGDGNCLFRAFSHLFTGGSQNGHVKIREKVCDFLQLYTDIFAKHCGKNHESFSNYIREMRADTTWGTDVELLACATMLNTPIATYFEGRWYTYLPRFGINDQMGPVRLSSIGSNKECYDKFIYLINSCEHYSPVISVV